MFIHLGAPQGDIKDNKVIWKGFQENSQWRVHFEELGITELGGKN